jgi:hypothetical protein
MSRVSSRLVLGEAGTAIISTTGTSDGNFDGVVALTTGTVSLTVSGTAYTNVAMWHGSSILGDITRVIYVSGGPFALYKDLP